MKQQIHSILIPLLLLVLSSSYAQNPAPLASDQKAYKKGERFFNNGNFVKAEEQFKILLDSGFRDHDLISHQAQSYLGLHEPHNAKNVILLSEKRDQELDYLLAMCHYFLEEFDDAYREIALVKDKEKYGVEDLKLHIKSTVEHYRDAEGYIVQNFGPEVNTKFREYASVMYNDFSHLLYTSRNDTSEYVAHDGFAYETIHGTSIDSLNRWHVADKYKFHTEHEKKHDATVQIYRKGKKLVTFHDGRLFTSHLVNNTWVEDAWLDLHGYEDVDTHCFISDDEKFIIFSSDFHSKGKDLDLFVSYKQSNKTWSTPVGIAELNTEFDEDAPFLADDSTLYFSSRGHGSLGGYDVFKSIFDKKTKHWSKPENLDYPINTVAEDIYFSIYGKVAYLSSTRVGGYGSLDLYRVLLFNKVMIEGVLLDEKTQEPIPDAQIEIVYDSLYFRTYTNKEGKYEMFVPINKKMKVTFVKDGVKLYEGQYFADAFFREENKRNFNFKVPDNVKVDTASAKSKSHFIHVDVKNTFEKTPYIMTVANDEVSNWSDSLKNFYEKKRISEFVPGPSPGLVTVYLDYNSSDLSSSAINVLDELYKDILEKHDFSIEISGHTDTRGSHGFNQKLSLKRAKVVANYLHGLGLKHIKVVVIGHGETKLIDETDSEESHAKNRRVEIKFE